MTLVVTENMIENFYKEYARCGPWPICGLTFGRYVEDRVKEEALRLRRSLAALSMKRGDK